MKNTILQAPKGTKDLLPQESYKWHYLEDKIKEVTTLYNVKEIRTPIFEHTELFLRGVGEGTDIVNKEMYTLLDKANRSLTLKPEGTAGVVRAYIENGLFNEAKPVKMYYVSPIFRYERPQKGRLRQHNQFGVEYFGSIDPYADAEVISLAVDFFKSLGINNIKVNINSIGDSSDREVYKAKLREYFIDKLDTLCPDCRSRYSTNVLRLLDCKIDAQKDIVKKAPSILNSLSKESASHFEKVQQALKNRGIPFAINDKIVRGLDYYNRTVFEIICEDIEGPSKVIAGGGRYDNLVEQLGGKPSPAVGFGLGIERALLLLEEFNIAVPLPQPIKVYIASTLEKFKEQVFSLASYLRENNVSCEFDLADKNLSAQLKYATKLQIPSAILVGETLTLKNLKNGEETPLSKQDLKAFIEQVRSK